MTSPTENKCGSCTACCKVYAIPQINKPAGDWCTHCAIGKGCKIYTRRPATCIDFECLWLQSQRHAPLPVELRPDKSKIVFNMSTNPKIITAVTMPGADDAWQRPAVRKLIDRILKGGVAVSIGPARTMVQRVLLPNGATKMVEMTEPDENGVQWSKENV